MSCETGRGWLEGFPDLDLVGVDPLVLVELDGAPDGLAGSFGQDVEVGQQLAAEEAAPRGAAR